MNYSFNQLGDEGQKELADNTLRFFKPKDFQIKHSALPQSRFPNYFKGTKKFKGILETRSKTNFTMKKLRPRKVMTQRHTGR